MANRSEYDLNTFLDPEDYCYPSGSIRQSRRKFRAMCPDGIVRTGVCGIADTYFSCPARLKAKGKTITGFIMMEHCYAEGCESKGKHWLWLVFVPYQYRKNAGTIGGNAK